jgi:hypothetical protein
VEDTITTINDIIKRSIVQQACFKQVQPILCSIQGMQVQCFFWVI